MSAGEHTRRERVYWACQLGGWSVVAAITIASLWAETGWVIAGLDAAVEVVIGIALTHGVRRWLRPSRWLALRAGRLVARVAGTIFLLALATVALLSVWERLAFAAPRPPLKVVIFAIIRWLPVFALWLGGYFAALASERRRQLELDRLRLGEALRASELRALKSQLNPHFLFNSLNSVRALIADDPERAQAAVTQLARLLRASLTVQDELVTLARELETIDDYLALESLRLGERLRVERDVSDAARTARLPLLLLQTLVENAIKHGVAELPEGGCVRLVARVDGAELQVAIENPRPAQARSHGDGIGLVNANQRLRLMFGDDARLTLDLSQPGVARAQLRLPVRP